MNLERLRALHAVADRGSVHAAARALHVTSSAISQQLAKLEEEVGQPLLERNGRGVRLTEAALLLADHTARALSVLTAAEAELDEQRTSVAGSLVVAAFPTAARGLAPRALKALAAAHPRLRVVLREQEPDVSVPLLVKGDLELLIAQDWADAPLAFPEGLSRATLLEDVADVALPANHKLAARSVVTLDELALDPWISWHPGTICYDGLLDALRSRGHEPVVSHTASEHATQLALVAAGLGNAVIPRLGREPVPGGVRIVRIKPALRRFVYAVWRADGSRRKAIRAAVDAFQSSAASLGRNNSRGSTRGRVYSRSRRKTAG